MARTGRFTLGRVSLVQLSDMVDRARQLGYGPNARVDVVLEVRDPNAPEHPRDNHAAGTTRQER
ncbi:hypothetical protein [Mycolicibacterium llatzerense]|uniref:hypothetical protein n=1 Tax=Mycolicibacterium llatzerense TaxID=280871 RepID=UPI0021B56CCD|nr:hypothetical protein [Mycolicibacterium llatzerense]MCT7372735.1 hypothetical protein [Mycolicibacterium llatzerense]